MRTRLKARCEGDEERWWKTLRQCAYLMFRNQFRLLRLTSLKTSDHQTRNNFFYSYKSYRDWRSQFFKTIWRNRSCKRRSSCSGTSTLSFSTLRGCLESILKLNGSVITSRASSVFVGGACPKAQEACLLTRLTYSYEFARACIHYAAHASSTREHDFFLTEASRANSASDQRFTDGCSIDGAKTAVPVVQSLARQAQEEVCEITRAHAADLDGNERRDLRDGFRNLVMMGDGILRRIEIEESRRQREAARKRRLRWAIFILPFMCVRLSVYWIFGCIRESGD